MRKIYIKKNNKEIHSNQGWLEIAPPEGGEKQWKPLHSASEFADYCLFTDGYVPKEIDDYLSSLGISDDSFDAEPECITSLCEYGFGKNGPRHHDLLMQSKEIVVGIEAKATETLDEYVTEKCKGKLSPNQELRYPGLCREILGRELKECSNIRYQLLSATAGTLIEARKRGVKKAALIILLFESEITSKEHVLGTKNDVDVFCNMLKKKPNGSYEIPFAPDIDFYVEYIGVCN